MWSQFFKRTTRGWIAHVCKRTGWYGEFGKAAGCFLTNASFDGDAPSYLQANTTWEATSNRAAKAKKTKYQGLAEELRASFTPLVCSTDCVLHTEYTAFQKRLAQKLATKWQRPYSVIMAWVRAQTQLAIIRAVFLWLRGTRRRIVSFHLQDGSPLRSI